MKNPSNKTRKRNAHPTKSVMSLRSVEARDGCIIFIVLRIFREVISISFFSDDNSRYFFPEVTNIYFYYFSISKSIIDSPNLFE